MKFRPIEERDISAIFEVRIATWHNEMGEEQMTRLGITRDSVKEMILQGSHQGWLCEIDEAVV
ncbi:MAG: GNAT family N-acetyltransferase, partial [Verrucomicrobiota bacterium]